MLNTNRLKGRITECGLTQKDVAATLGIATATASQKINGIRPLYLDEAEKLANLLRIDAKHFSDYFFAR